MHFHVLAASHHYWKGLCMSMQMTSALNFYYISELGCVDSETLNAEYNIYVTLNETNSDYIMHFSVFIQSVKHNKKCT